MNQISQKKILKTWNNLTHGTRRRTDGWTTTKADADETTTPTTGRMNPEYDYLFKLLVRARARRCDVRAR